MPVSPSATTWSTASSAATCPPVLGAHTRTGTTAPDFRFASGMTIVVQPNLVTQDETAGVQTGELVLVAEHGVERLHGYERGLLKAPLD